MRTIKLIKYFKFEERNRSRLTLDSKVRLNPDRNAIMLKEETEGVFPLDSDLFAKTWIAEPRSARKWIGFEVDSRNVEVDGVVLTSLGFRLLDGTNEFFFNGSDWEVNTADWNSEEEVASNIQSFPVTGRKLGIAINLKTSNASYSPEVGQIKVLFESDIEFQEDLVYRSLVPLFRDSLRPRSRHVFTLRSATNKIDLKTDYKIDTPYNIRAVDGAYNHSDDPDHEADLCASFDPATLSVNLSSTVASGKVMWIDFLWEPEVVVTTSQDYSEVEKVPSVVLDDVKLVDTAETGQSDSVFNKATGEGWKIHPPLQGDLEINLHGLTDKGIDQMRLADELKRFFANNPLLRSKGLDEEYSLWLIDEYDMSTFANRGEVHTGALRFRVRDVLFFVKEAEAAAMIKSFRLTGDMNAIVE